MAYFDPKTGTWVDGPAPPEQAKGFGSDAVPGGPTSKANRGSADPRQWGGYGRAHDVNGNPEIGSSGGERDVARYRGMAKPTATTPIIDQARSNESRGYQDRGLGYLGSAATGETSFARDLGQKQAIAAGRSAQSLAATVRGGPMARAAAMRGVNQNAGALQARAKLATDAAAANEQAGARGAYAGALAGQRAQDLGVATSQSGLELGQRTADDQREGFYEGLGWDTANTQLETALGVSRGDQAAAAARRQAADAASAQGTKNTMDMINASVGGTTGLVQGAAHVNDPKPGYDPNKPLSDVRSKEHITSLDELAKRGQKAADDARTVSRATLEAGPYLGRASKGDDGPIGKAALDRAIGDRVEADAPRYGYLGEGPSAGRSSSGHAIRQSLDGGPGYAGAPADFLASYMHGHEQEPMLSDDKTKLAKAWDEGHAAAIADVEKTSRLPAADIKKRSEGDDYHPAAATVRSIKGRAWDEGNETGRTSAQMQGNRDKLEAQAPGLASEQDARIEAQVRKNRFGLEMGKAALAAHMEKKDAPPPPPPPVAEQPQGQPGYFSQLLGRGRAMMMSDERSKESKGYQPGAMASALRSMRPSVYEYKPAYAGRAGQDVGEKNVGPMANPMAKDPVASTAIERQPDGMLAIDKDKGLKLALGGLADVQMQIDDLKRRKGAAA